MTVTITTLAVILTWFICLIAIKYYEDYLEKDSLLEEAGEIRLWADSSTITLASYQDLVEEVEDVNKRARYNWLINTDLIDPISVRSKRITIVQKRHEKDQYDQKDGIRIMKGNEV